MNSALKSARHVYLLILILLRSIRWLAILCFCKKEQIWGILDYQMYLNTHGIGLDLKENNIHKQLILDRIREPHATKIMKQFIQPDDVILEIGANIGYYVLMEAKILSENGYIYAIEPEPSNFDLLKKNVQLNKIENIELKNIAISNKKEIAKLYIGKASNLHTLIKKTEENISNEFVEVETETVDSFMTGRRPVTFIRMDIEGYEVNIFENMENTLALPSLKKIFIEIHPPSVPLEKMRNLLQTLLNNGFEIKYAVSRDNFYRAILGQAKTEEITILQLLEDSRFLNQECCFELFFMRD